jgi:hypothetical protein
LMRQEWDEGFLLPYPPLLVLTTEEQGKKKSILYVMCSREPAGQTHV